ncbi:MAG: hypothetical protein KY459_08850 [Acidobacteria bacterium]|nr:hypothetical protein [Acidobacteriota bacterium]
MISEAIGKILGMAMAYAVSALGLLLAYYNYRKRVVKAERVMSGTAWVVVAIVFLAIGAGAWTIMQIAGAEAEAVIEQAEPHVVDDAPIAEETVPAPEPSPDRAALPVRTERWPWIGIVIPASIFLVATWLTAALHHHFSAKRPE